jgi:hypothetical protein
MKSSKKYQKYKLILQIKINKLLIMNLIIVKYLKHQTLISFLIMLRMKQNKKKYNKNNNLMNFIRNFIY